MSELERRPSAAIPEGTGHPKGEPFTKWTYVDLGCRCARCTASFKRSKLYTPEPVLDVLGRPFTGFPQHDRYLGSWDAGCRCEGCFDDA